MSEFGKHVTKFYQTVFFNEKIDKRQDETINKLIEQNTENENKSGVKFMLLPNGGKNIFECTQYFFLKNLKKII